MIENNGTLIIKGDGTISFKDTGAGDKNYGWGSYTIINKGILTIENTSIFNESNIAGPHVAYTIDSYGTLNMDGGEVIFEHGHALRMGAFSNSAVNTTINDGLIKGTRTIMMQLPGKDGASAPEMSLTINGGELITLGEISQGYEYKLNIYAFSNGQSGKNTSINITGGTFNGWSVIDEKMTATMEDKAFSVSGGTFTSDWPIFSYHSDEDLVAAKLAITGGTFATDDCAYYAWDDGYQFVQNESTGYYELKPITAE